MARNKPFRPHGTETTKPTAPPPMPPVVVGFDGGYVRSRHRQEERHFEVIAGKVIDVDGIQHRFAFARNGQAASVEAFAQALAAAGVHADTSATVLCDGDAGLWRLQRETLPAATLVLDWWHIAMRFEHALQAARSHPVPCLRRNRRTHGDESEICDNVFEHRLVSMPANAGVGWIFVDEDLLN
jgi:hypothetical protein